MEAETEQLALAEKGGQDAVSEAGDAQDAPAGIENPGEAVLTSGMSVADYIAGVQLSREQVRARNKETLMSLINSTSIDEAAKQQAIQDMIRLTEISEKENAAETTDPQRAQIEDIVKRKTEVGADQIIITLLNMEE